MSNEEIIREELENLGFKLTETNHTLFTFMDNTRRIGVETRVYYDDKIYFHVFLRGYGYLKTIFQTAIIPFDSRKSELSKVENILNKNRQLIKQQNQYSGALKCIQEIDNFSHILREITAHFSQFGKRESFCVVVAGCFGKMIIYLKASLQLLVDVDLKDLDRSTVFRETLANANYVEVFSKVDELIIEFKKKVPDVIRYAELLKESADL